MTRNTTPPVKTLQTGAIASLLVLAAASAAGKPTRESQKRSGQSRGINTGQAAHLSDPEGAGGELAGDASLPSAPYIAR